ncbi:MAG TPA: hypothetical protein VGC20_03475 [bacterium]|jgi:hypothetical protein
MEAKPYLNRPYLRVFFECCSIYQRIYRDPDGHAYSGRCPRCLRPIRFRVGPNGTPARDFAVR